MASSPQYKLYNASQEYVGCLKDLEDAAAMVNILGNGATIRVGHTKRGTLWTEGQEEFSAGESYDQAAEVMYKRLLKRYNRVTG